MNFAFWIVSLHTQSYFDGEKLIVEFANALQTTERSGSPSGAKPFSMEIFADDQNKLLVGIIKGCEIGCVGFFVCLLLGECYEQDNEYEYEYDVLHQVACTLTLPASITISVALLQLIDIKE